jgi:hypothetical protein
MVGCMFDNDSTQITVLSLCFYVHSGPGVVLGLTR